MANVSALLEELCNFSSVDILLTVEHIYGALADVSHAVRQDVLESGSMQGLVGMLVHSKQDSMKQLALNKLGAVLDGCSGRDFMHFLSDSGGLKWLYDRLTAVAAAEGSQQGPVYAATAKQVSILLGSANSLQGLTIYGNPALMSAYWFLPVILVIQQHRCSGRMGTVYCKLQLPCSCSV